MGWILLDTYCAIVQGNSRNRYPGCHSIADMALVVGGPLVKELVGFLFMVIYVTVAGSGIINVPAVSNAQPLHSICTVWFMFIATASITLLQVYANAHTMADST